MLAYSSLSPIVRLPNKVINSVICQINKKQKKINLINITFEAEKSVRN